ncbi:uncharacterized protein VTP21DRAFT_5055 [Calcarisporiella thermophila]|uniref:uncharacterized protein n=1 Tax=Calcarisporiella thermophila TaxID=911321 RepID=UPI0037421679
MSHQTWSKDSEKQQNGNLGDSSVEPETDISTVEENRIAENTPTTTEAPDGGYGWLVVLGAFLCQWVIFGYGLTWGVYEEYYQNVQFKGQASPSVISLIGTVGTALVVVCGPINGPLVDRFGVRTLLAAATIILPLGLILASFSTQIWQLFLTQGVLYGLGSSLSFFPSVGTIPEWFTKHRGLASGIAVCGTGIGGLVLSPVTSKLIAVIGIGWTLRIIGIMAFIMLATATILIKGRVVRDKARPFTVDVSLLKQKKLALYIVAIAIEYFAYVVPFYLTPEFSFTIGLGRENGSLFVALMNGANAVGRIVLGLAADRLGRINVMCFCLIFSSLSILLIWNFSFSFAPMCIFSLFYGFFGGGFVTLVGVVTAELSGIGNLPSALGLVFASTFVGNLVGTPIAAALHKPSLSNPYLPSILFSGFMTLLSGLIIFLLKLTCNRSVMGKV